MKLFLTMALITSFSAQAQLVGSGPVSCMGAVDDALTAGVVYRGVTVTVAGGDVRTEGARTAWFGDNSELRNIAFGKCQKAVQAESCSSNESLEECQVRIIDIGYLAMQSESGKAIAHANSAQARDYQRTQDRTMTGKSNRL